MGKSWTAEIVVKGRSHILPVDKEALNVSIPAEAVVRLHEIIKAKGVIATENEALYLADSAPELIRVWIPPEDPEGVVDPPVEPALELPAPRRSKPLGPAILRDKITFLGTTRDITVVAVFKNDKVYYILQEVDDSPAMEMLSERGYTELMAAWLERVDPRSYEVITPVVQLPDYDEAAAYLEDYIRETEKPYEAKVKDAKAIFIRE